MQKDRAVRKKAAAAYHAGGSPLNTDWTLVRLVVCAAVLLAASSVRFLLPDLSESVRAFVLGSINQNVEYRQAFEEIGRALGGGADIVEIFRGLYYGEDEARQADGTPQNTEEPESIITPASDPPPSSAQPTNTPPPSALPSSTPAPVATPTPEELSFLRDDREDADDTAPVPFQIPPPDIVRVGFVELGFEYAPPLEGEITSPFGYRDHPLEDDTNFHYGVDLRAAIGTPVGCFADGIVEETGAGNINGKFIRVRHDEFTVSFYAHLHSVAVKKGDTVKLGQVIGKSGDSGKATGPHLHFQLYYDEHIIDPTPYLFLPEAVND